MSKTKFDPAPIQYDVGDAVRIYAPQPNSPFYLVGRIIYIDYLTKNKEYEYGIIYYGRNNNILTLHVTANKMIQSPVPNPPSCPSHNFTMDYVDEMAEREKKETLPGTPIKNMQIGGACEITVEFKDGREDNFWNFEEDDNGKITLIDDEDNEYTTEEQLRELGIEQIFFSDSYILWS